MKILIDFVLENSFFYSFVERAGQTEADKGIYI